MERITQEQDDERGREINEGWDAWNAVPRDGPAVFVVDLQAMETQGRVHGRWMNPMRKSEEVTAELREVLGREPDVNTWAVIDQVDLGPRMIPDTLAPMELPVAALEALHEAGQ